MMTEKQTPKLPVVKKEVKKKVYPKCRMVQIISDIEENCAPVKLTTYGGGKHNVVILPEAWEELRHMIYFGKKHPVNIYEQQYQGMGHIFIDDQGIITVVISHFLYIYSACRSQTSACVVLDKYDNMMKKLEQEREIYNKFEEECNVTTDGYLYDPFISFGLSEVVLFGHTHPGLGVFFSADDCKSGYSTKDFPAVTFVCDPHKKDMKAMIGLQQEMAKIFVCTYSQEKVSVKDKVHETVVIKENSSKPVSLEELVSDISTSCNAVLAQGVKGKYESYYGRTGQLYVNFSMKCKATKQTILNIKKREI